MNTTNTTHANSVISIRGLADLTGLDRDTCRAAITRAELKPAGTRGGYPAYALRDAVRALFVRRGEIDPETLTPTDRKAYAQAQLAELALKVKSGEFLPRDSYRAATATAFSTCASSIRMIPDTLARKVTLSPEQADLCERVIDDILNSLADDLERAHNEASQRLAEG